MTQHSAGGDERAVPAGPFTPGHGSRADPAPIDGLAARSYAIDPDEALDAFLVVTASGEVATSFGGPVPEIRFNVAHLR
jgi:hypothetical protein